MAKQRGTSAFTVQDSVDTPLHSGVSEEMHVAQHRAVAEADVNKGAELGEVVFGPGAFGSPDPKTLAHHLLTDGDGQLTSETAPELADDYAANSGLGEVDSTDLEQMNKDDLVNYAEQRGIDTSGMKKAEILDALNNDNSNDDNSNDDSDANTQANESMTKDELLALANEQGVTVDETMTKADIVDAINNNG